MEIQRFVYKPTYVHAVLVTETNMAAVAKWCGGDVQTAPSRPDKEGSGNFIKVDVPRPVTIRQTQAFPGDHVVKTQFQGFKVYTPRAFDGAFDPVANDAEDRPSPVGVSKTG